MDTTARIRAKGLESTGVTEELANSLWAAPGRTLLAVVELQAVEPHGPTLDGKRRIDLVLNLVEPVTDDSLEPRVRDLMRALYRDRKAAAGDMLPESSDDPRTAGDIAAGLPAWDGDTEGPLTEPEPAASR